MKFTLPDEYRLLDDKTIIDRIKKKKIELGEKLLILGHHYQRIEIIELSDVIGDSFRLSREAAENQKARYIVFCGVNFMVESAATLCRSDQVVLHPDTDAGCPMADMADIFDVEKAWNQIVDISSGKKIIPITYINSDSEVKAFCGKNGGCVCTSSNTPVIFDWALNRADKIFFLPDEHLGRNTANKKGIPKEDVILWDPSLENGGNTKKSIEKSKVILWNGYCHVHTFFTLEHIKNARSKFPGGIIIVHPECKEEIVKSSDYDGSTGFIVRFVEDALPGSTVIIGTEINLIGRLAKEHPDKKIIPLARSICPNMWKVSLNDLLFTLDNIGKVNVIKLKENIREYAKIALRKMLEITA